MSRRAKLLAGVVMALVSVAFLALPLAVFLVPLFAHFYTIGISADLHGMQILSATGIAGGASLIGAFWLIVSGRKQV